MSGGNESLYPRHVVISPFAGLNAMKVLLQYQASMLRVWANNCELAAHNFTRGTRNAQVCTGTQSCTRTATRGGLISCDFGGTRGTSRTWSLSRSLRCSPALTSRRGCPKCQFVQATKSTLVADRTFSVSCGATLMVRSVGG